MVQNKMGIHPFESFQIQNVEISNKRENWRGGEGTE